MVTSDILCGDCTGDAYLERPFTFSTPHLCKSMELIRKGPGSYDAEYPERDDAGATMAGVIVGIITVLCEIVVAIFIIRRKRKKYQTPTQPDTTTSDSLCGACTGDAYSSRSFSFSTPYNLCESMELMHLIRKGPGSYDAEYADRDNSGAIMAGVIVGIITVLCEIVVAIFIIPWKWKKYQSPTQPDASMKLYCMSLLHSSLNTTLKSVGPKPSNEILPKLVIIAVILLLTVPGVSPACGRAEYLIGEECCPMCGPGYYVRRHCTEFTSTTCVPCPASTFTDAPNGLVSCRSCTVCDSGEGLRVKRPCSSTLDALCEPLDGYYCIDPIKDGCRGAKEHTKCNSGQYIKQQGTATSDSMCGDCVGDTYSDGSFTSCRPHTQCELMGLIVKRKGTTSNDTECAERGYTITIAVGVTVVGILAVCGVLVGIIIYRKRKKHEQGAQPDILGVFLNRVQREAHDSQVHNPVETTQVQLFTQEQGEHRGVIT